MSFKRKYVVLAAALLIIVTMLGGALLVSANSSTLLDSVNIGDTTLESGHNLTGWTRVWSGCGWCGPDGNMRLIWGDGGEPSTLEYNWASVTLDAGTGWATSLKVEHLAGAADDSFNVYVNDQYIAWCEDTVGSNQWFVDEFDISLYNFTGVLTIKFVATGPAWSGIGTYGQIAFNLIELYGSAYRPVTIDIKPGSDPNSINLGSKGVVPVAILGSADFDAATVDPSTIMLAGSGVRVKGKSENYGSLEDVNDDGYLDLVVQVYTEDLTMTGSGIAELTGQTYGGMDIYGTDSIRVVPPE